MVCGGESEGVAKTAAQKKRGRRNMPKVDNDARKLSNTDQFVGNSKTKTPKLCCLCSFVCFLCIDVICLLLFLPCVFPFLPPYLPPFLPFFLPSPFFLPAFFLPPAIMSLSVLDQVLEGFRREGEAFRVRDSVKLPSDKLRAQLGLDEQHQARLNRHSGQARDVMSAWATTRDALPPDVTEKELGVQRRRRSRPGSAVAHGAAVSADHSSAGARRAAGGTLDALYRGGQEELEARAGKKTVQPNTDPHAGKDLFRGETFEQQVPRKRRTDTTAAATTAAKKTDPWSAVTQDDVAKQRAQLRAERTKHLRDPSDPFRSEDPSAGTIPRKQRTSKPASLSVAGGGNILAYNERYDADAIAQRRMRRPPSAQQERTDPWGSTSNHILKYEKR